MKCIGIKGVMIYCGFECYQNNKFSYVIQSINYDDN